MKMDFYKRVAYVCGQIPYGTVATYGQIALLCGKPRNARQVGYALNRRTPWTVPAHRVVNAQGHLSGAGSFETSGSQQEQLEAEGITVEEGQNVSLKKFGWHHTLETALELHQYFLDANI